MLRVVERVWIILVKAPLLLLFFFFAIAPNSMILIYSQKALRFDALANAFNFLHYFGRGSVIVKV
jgi:hypothetical protein